MVVGWLCLSEGLHMRLSASYLTMLLPLALQLLAHAELWRARSRHEQRWLLNDGCHLNALIGATAPVGEWWGLWGGALSAMVDERRTWCELLHQAALHQHLLVHVLVDVCCL